jgi:hypothetical protein
MTTGDYVCFLGADNRLRSDFLEHTVGSLDMHSEAAIAYTDFALFGSRASLIAAEFEEFYPVKQKGDFYHVVEFPEFTGETREVLLTKRNFIHGSSLFRRQAFDQVGGYSLANGPEDWFLFQRMIKAGWSAVHCGIPLLEYRQHSRNQANIRLISEIELKYYKEGYKELYSEIQRVKGTVSWRITAPLRASWNIPKGLLKKAKRLIRHIVK